MADNLKNLKIAVPFVKILHPFIKDIIINHTTIYNTNAYYTMYFTRSVRISNCWHEKYDQLAQVCPIPKQDIIRLRNNMIFSAHIRYTLPPK